MASYGSNSGGYNVSLGGYSSSTMGYNIVGPTSYGSHYGVKRNIWKKVVCCGARNGGTPCTDCPG